ncbi:MAG TPA: hypothetical protein DDW17_02070 [Deltaproteobacteria bacterium]|nr:hypothetical protein [Deltaproteobacteria bacterium]
MIEIRPEAVIIEMGIEEADLLRFYLSKSVLKSDGGYSNPCAVEAENGNKVAIKAMKLRQAIIGCLDNALIKAVEDADGRNYSVRKILST